MSEKQLLIAGPCAVESEEQLEIAMREAAARKADFLRTNLWKPRTEPGFEGLGKAGLPLLGKVALAGLSPALEVITAEDARQAMAATLPHMGEDGRLLLWIGARNQNHRVQKEIAEAAMGDPRVLLMAKNQPWRDMRHWRGIFRHILSTGFPAERLLSCHRGFAPGNDRNPNGLRNLPDFTGAAQIAQEFGVRDIFDPSHTGGSVPNVFEMAKQAARHRPGGLIIEVHHDPVNALTDQNQQITWPQFDRLVEVARGA